MSTAFRISHAERNFGAAFRQHHPEQDAAKDETERFKTLFADILRECSPSHIQACSDWVIDHVLPSPAVVEAFGGFLISISAAYSAEKQKKDGLSKAEIKARLWPLTFIINEVLHTTKFHLHDRQVYEDCTSVLRVPIISLFKDLAQFERRANQKHFNRLLGILAFWHKQGYFDENYIASLKALVESEGLQLPAEVKEFASSKQKRSHADADAPRKRKKIDPTKGIQILGGIDNVAEDGTWRLPEWHGGENTAWHLLPAASWLKPLQLTDHDDGQGMKKRDFRPIKFKGDAVSRQVRKEVMALLNQADQIYNPVPDIAKRIDYDQMGRKMEVIKIRKGADGKIKKYVRCDTYYGWSPKFLAEMYRHPEKGFLAQIKRGQSKPSSRRSNSPLRRPPTPETHDSEELNAMRQTPTNVTAQAFQTPLPPNAGYAPPPPYPQQGFVPHPPIQPPWVQNQQAFSPAGPVGRSAPWPPPVPPPPPPPFPMMGHNGWPQPGHLPPPPPPPPPGQGFNSGYNNAFRGTYGGSNRGGYGNQGSRDGYGRGSY